MEYKDKIMLCCFKKMKREQVLLQGFDITYIIFYVKPLACASVA